MLKIIPRYLFREVTLTWLVVASVLLILTIGLGLSRFIADAAAGHVPVDTVVELAALSAVNNLEIVLPVSVLLAVLLVIGRLCRDNEMAALFSGAVGLRRLYRPFFVFAAIVAALGGALSMAWAPQAEVTMHRLGEQTAASMVQSVTAGRFASFQNGKIAFYVKRRSENGTLHHVFLRVLGKNEKGKKTQTVITAKQARQRVDPDTHKVTLVLNDGWRYEGIPGQADYRVVEFDEHGVQLRPPVTQSSNDVGTQGTIKLMSSNDPEAIAEWQQRISVPLSILILTLLALPLGRAPPRAGRYGRVVAGILFYVLYVNGVHLATTGIEEGALPAFIGVWWVHAIVLVIAAVLVLREQGYRLPGRRAQ